MNTMKWVSVIALGLAGTLAVACGGDDDDDNPGTQGTGGKSGSAGSAGSGSGSGGSAGGGMGSSGAGGGGGSMLPLPPLDAGKLKTALDAGNYLPSEKADKWACSQEEVDGKNLGETKNEAHAFDENGEQVDTAPARNCANFSLAQLDFKGEDDGGNKAGWPIGAAAVKETLDANDNVIEIAYFALKPDLTWYFATAVPAEGEDLQPAGPGRNYTVTDGSGCASCHAEGNAGGVVKVANLVEPDEGQDLADPNPYEELGTVLVSRAKAAPPAGKPVRGASCFVAAKLRRSATSKRRGWGSRSMQWPLQYRVAPTRLHPSKAPYRQSYGRK